MTRADRSTFRGAWIFPLAVTFETRSTFSTLAVVTWGRFRSLLLREPMSTTASTAATASPMTIFHFFDIGPFPLTANPSLLFLTALADESSPSSVAPSAARSGGGWCAQEDSNPQPPDP